MVGKFNGFTNHPQESPSSPNFPIMSNETDDVKAVEQLGIARDGVVKELRNRGYSLITDTPTPTC
ncbi:MAG: hypothetical protein ACI8XO_001894 [Verrucomicrobiales bacterium]